MIYIEKLMMLGPLNTLEAKVLPPPSISVGNNKTIKPTSDTFSDQMKGMFYKTTSLKNWILAVFGSNTELGDALVQTLRKVGEDMAIPVSNPTFKVKLDSRKDYISTLE